MVGKGRHFSACSNFATDASLQRAVDSVVDLRQSRFGRVEMTQNIIDITFSADAVTAIEAALTELETQLASLIALTPDQRRKRGRR